MTRHAPTVLSTLAIVLALGGTATAAGTGVLDGHKLKAHSVGTRALSPAVLARMSDGKNIRKGTIRLAAFDDATVAFFGRDGQPGTPGLNGRDGSNAAMVGPAGADGSTGPTGPRGFNGYDCRGVEQTTANPNPTPTCPGATGSAGLDGSNCAGERGNYTRQCSGPAGPAGADSTVAGPTGATGATGARGATGADSTVAGPKGDKGDAGATGDTGPRGATGATGDTGPRGHDGTGAVTLVRGPSVTAQGTVSVTATCPAGTIPLGGGWGASGGEDVHVSTDEPTATGWHAELRVVSNTPEAWATVICGASA